MNDHARHRVKPVRIQRSRQMHIPSPDAPTAGQQGEAAVKQIEHLKDVLHRDQTGLAKALAEVVRTAEGFEWATCGRGPYEWDDDEYRKEFGRALSGIKAIAESGLKTSGDLAHRECCGRVSRPAPDSIPAVPAR